MRATELRVEQFPKFEKVFMTIIQAVVKHRDSSKSTGDELLTHMLVPYLAPCRFGAQPGFDDALDVQSLLRFLEQDYGLSRLDFSSHVHECMIDGLFRAGESQESKGVF